MMCNKSYVYFYIYSLNTSILTNIDLNFTLSNLISFSFQYHFHNTIFFKHIVLFTCTFICYDWMFHCYMYVVLSIYSYFKFCYSVKIIRNTPCALNKLYGFLNSIQYCISQQFTFIMSCSILNFLWLIGRWNLSYIKWISFSESDILCVMSSLWNTSLDFDPKIFSRSQCYMHAYIIPYPYYMYVH